MGGLFWSAMLLGLMGSLGLRPASAADGRDLPGIDADHQIRRMGRGINILGYDPIWNDRTKARFRREHFETIRKGGFQTVRVNLQAFAHMDGENRLDPDWFRTLDWVVDNALAAGLIVILDEHDFNLCSEDPAACRPRLLAFWRQLSSRYRGSPDTVLFELENEPHGALTPTLWNALLAELLAVVRETNPKRTIVIGPGSFNDGQYLPALQLPDLDRNIIVTVHYYVPMSFTHQGAPWDREWVDQSGVDWGDRADRLRLEADFDKVADWAQIHRRPILLGEFGAYEKGALPARVRYDAAVARAAERRGWAWCYWQFDSDFVAFDMASNDWVKPIWRALVPSPSLPFHAGRK